MIKDDGDTALWDALALGMDQLVEYGKRYPQAKKRIICISDSLDNKSITNTAADVCWRLRQADIVVDSVSLGQERNSDLRPLSYLLGAYRFHPTTLANALAICELEPFLSLTERPAVSPPARGLRDRTSALTDFKRAKSRAGTTEANEHEFPERKPHPNMNDYFIQLSNFVKSRAATSGGSSSSGSSSRPSQQLRTSRLLNEIRATANTAHPKYDVYVRFATRIKHPNVNLHGRVCHSILDRDWTTDTSMTDILNSVYALLFQPEYMDPVSTTAALGIHQDGAGFADEVRAFVRRYATKSRAEWRVELLGSS
ncbi:hypothetical protein PG994_004345 [Apiospora phragmitis]|uniref:UBC core domain-containing protein n=1 Tax=Apiospora phragmitis TaxID=2905665 RepID=A0ABR1VT08_9PEZI